MASIGLKINQPDDFSGANTQLADVFSKALFGDPEAAAKIALAKAHIAAQNAYATKLGADTGLVNEKTTEQRTLDAARAAAATPAGDAFAAAVPMPIPVEAPHPSTDFMGPMPGIVKPEDQKLYDAEVAAAHKLGPLIVTAGGNPTEIAQGFSRGLGTFGVVNQPDPNKARTFGGLAVDAQPTVNTVQTAGDTAGQDAKAKAGHRRRTGEDRRPGQAAGHQGRRRRLCVDRPQDQHRDADRRRKPPTVRRHERGPRARDRCFGQGQDRPGSAGQS